MTIKLAHNMFTQFKAVQKVKEAYKNNPTACSTAAGFVTFAAGDIFAQKLENSAAKPNQKYDFQRALQLGLLGAAMNGIILHKWFVLLDKTVTTARNSVTIKVLADQVIFAPFAILAFFGYALASQPDASFGMNKLQQKIDTEFLPTYLVDCSIWPVANVVNFKFVPLIYRASFTAVLQLGWQTYLSLVTYTNDDVRGTLLPIVLCEDIASTEVKAGKGGNVEVRPLCK